MGVRGINEDSLHIELAGLSLTLVFLFPVGDGRPEEFLHLAGSLLVGEFEYAEGLERFLAADHVDHETHLAGRRGHVAEHRTVLRLASLLDGFG